MSFSFFYNGAFFKLMSLACRLKKYKLNSATLHIPLFSRFAAVSQTLFFREKEAPLDRLMASPLLLKVAFCLTISNRPSRLCYCASED